MLTNPVLGVFHNKAADTCSVLSARNSENGLPWRGRASSSSSDAPIGSSDNYDFSNDDDEESAYVAQSFSFSKTDNVDGGQQQQDSGPSQKRVGVLIRIRHNTDVLGAAGCIARSVREHDKVREM